MSYFEGMDLSKLFDDESEYGKNFVFGELTDEQISRAEETIGYKFPESYKELLRFMNGGCINDDLDERWIDAIYGVSPDPDNYYGLKTKSLR